MQAARRADCQASVWLPACDAQTSGVADVHCQHNLVATNSTTTYPARSIQFNCRVKRVNDMSRWCCTWAEMHRLRTMKCGSASSARAPLNMKPSQPDGCLQDSAAARASATAATRKQHTCISHCVVQHPNQPYAVRHNMRAAAHADCRVQHCPVLTTKQQIQSLKPITTSRQQGPKQKSCLRCRQHAKRCRTNKPECMPRCC
jgi:hypothetical protein